MTSWDPYNRNCPSRQLLDRIGDRWTVLIIGALRDQPLRFSELTRRVDGVSQKMLTQTLRALECDGFVKRDVVEGPPIKVSYCLTALGQSLCDPLDALTAWAVNHMDDVMERRAIHS